MTEVWPDKFSPLTNCSSLNDFPLDEIPVQFFLPNLDTIYMGTLAVGSAVTFLVVLLFILHWHSIWNYVGSEWRQNLLYWLMGLFPFTSICLLTGMIMPRTAMITTAFGNIYFMMCLFAIISLMRHLFGGRTAMARVLNIKGNDNKMQMINFAKPPLCCCCAKCLPKFKPTEQNLRRVEWLVLQAPLFQIAIIMMNLVCIFEVRDHRYFYWAQVTDYLVLISLLLAIWGCHTLSNLATVHLSEYGFGYIFHLVDFALLLFGVQKMLIFDNLERLGIFACGPLLTPRQKSTYWNNFLLILEMLLLSILITHLLGAANNAIFDRDPRRLQAARRHEEQVLTEEEGQQQEAFLTCRNE